MNLKDTPIQRKLMNVILLTCAVVLSIMCAAYIILEYLTSREAIEKQVSTLGAVIASNSSAALAFDSPEDAAEILNGLKAEKNIVAACIYDNNGNIFTTYTIDPKKYKFPASPGEAGYKIYEGFLIGFEPVKQADFFLGTLFLQYDLNPLYAQLRYYTLIGIALISGSLFIAFLLSRLLQRTISQPILSLEKTAKIISEKKDYSVRAHQYGKDELGALTNAFNQMLDQIQKQNKEITQFNQNLEQKVSERTTELQTANVILKQQKDFVETVINSSVSLIVVYDKYLRYVMINNRAEEYFPLPKDDLIGKNFLEVFPQLQDKKPHTDLKCALNGEFIHNPSFKSLISNRYFENFVIPLKDGGNNIYGVLTIAHDITEIMESNEKLENVNAELRKSNRDLEQFAYVASHDLQEPLRKIQIFTQLLKENADDKDAIEKYQEKIYTSANRMQLLIQDVLNFSRISKSEEAFIDTDLNQVMETLKSDFEFLINEKKAKINYSKMPVVKGLPLQLSQLFSNLLSNSLKYNKRQPVIDITCQKVTHDELKDIPYQLNGASSYYHFKFKDNGIGFESQYNEQIFSIFKRLHGKQDYSGTGIGLALCKKIVENHHGVIYAEGKPGVGSVFHVIIPA